MDRGLQSLGVGRASVDVKVGTRAGDQQTTAAVCHDRAVVRQVRQHGSRCCVGGGDVLAVVPVVPGDAAAQRSQPPRQVLDQRRIQHLRHVVHGRPRPAADWRRRREHSRPPLIQVTVHRFRRWHFPLPVSTHVDSRATRFPLRLPVCSHRVGIPIFGIKSANFDARQRCFFALPVTTGVDSGATIFTSRAGL